MRWRVPVDTARSAILVLSKNSRFPKPDALFDGRRYWPAVCAFMRWRAGMASTIEVADGEEHFDRDPARPREHIDKRS